MFRCLTYSLFILATCSGAAFANGLASTHIIYDGHSDPATVIEKLHLQNESLRATIRAQNEVLKSTDNAAHAAKQRGQENAFLKNQVAILQNTVQEDRQVLKDLQDLVAVLQDEIAKRDALLSSASEDVVQDDQVGSQRINPALILSELDTLRQENEALQNKLDRERDIASAYRAKIAEYQKQQRDMNVATTASSMHAQSIGYSQDELNKVKAENQILKARIQLLEQY